MSGAVEDNEKAVALLAALKTKLPTELRRNDREDLGFRKRCYKRWKPGMDLLKMMLICSREFGSTYNERSRPLAARDQNFKFEAIVGLHARSLRVANEICALLIAGFPDGALSRWRSLHELAVVCYFLSGQNNEISKRFLAHRVIASWKAMKQHDEFSPRSKMAPFGPEKLAKAKSQRDASVEEFGIEFSEDMGWAFPAINKTKRINLHDLEVATGLDHWRPRFRWASDDIHAGHKPYHASLSADESADPVLVVGQSNSAFTDPAHMCAISLNLANHALPSEYYSGDDATILLMLRHLSDEIGETFFAIDMETGKRAANASLGRSEG
jgi:hypothetical protein